jgi:hypothetical protein
MTAAPAPLFGALRRDPALKIVLAVFLVYWICMLPALVGSASASKAAARALTLPAMFAMAWIAGTKIRELLRSLAVLGQLQAPHRLRLLQIGEHLRVVGLTWAFLAFGACLQLALPASGAAAISGAALVSLAGLVGLARALASSGVLPPVARDLGNAIAIALVGALIAFDQNRLLDWFGGLPSALLMLVALLFPAALALLAARWKAALPHYRWCPPSPANKFAEWLQAQNRRTTILTWRKTWDGDKEHRFFSVNSILARLLIQSVPVFFLLGSPLWAKGQLHPVGSVQLLLVAGIIASSLVVRDMHWRSLLRPGGLHRGRIATHIWISTVTIQMLICAVLALVYLAFDGTGFDATLSILGLKLAAVASLPVELCIATSMAVLLRATPHDEPWTGIIYVLMLVLLGGPIFAIGKLGFEIDVPLWAYIAGSAFTCFALIALANRVWTTRRLFAEAAKNANI